jgi:copper(I)-binding protein
MKILKIALVSMALFSNVYAADLTFEHVKVRASVPGTTNSAAFMNIHNNSNEKVEIVAAESTASKVAELHTHTMIDGKMAMRQIPSIEIPANSMVELKPGGLHVMLLGLNQPLIEDTTTEITLILESGEKITLTPKVKNIMRSMSH